jgi:hypothetical protein
MTHKNKNSIEIPVKNALMSQQQIKILYTFLLSSLPTHRVFFSPLPTVQHKTKIINSISSNNVKQCSVSLSTKATWLPLLHSFSISRCCTTSYFCELRANTSYDELSSSYIFNSKVLHKTRSIWLIIVVSWVRVGLNSVKLDSVIGLQPYYGFLFECMEFDTCSFLCITIFNSSIYSLLCITIVNSSTVVHVHSCASILQKSQALLIVWTNDHWIFWNHDNLSSETTAFVPFGNHEFSHLENSDFGRPIVHQRWGHLKNIPTFNFVHLKTYDLQAIWTYDLQVIFELWPSGRARTMNFEPSETTTFKSPWIDNFSIVLKSWPLVHLEIRAFESSEIMTFRSS